MSNKSTDISPIRLKTNKDKDYTRIKMEESKEYTLESNSFLDTSNDNNDKLNDLSPTWKICYDCKHDSDSVENPIIEPCRCTSNKRYMHVNCLRA